MKANEATLPVTVRPSEKKDQPESGMQGAKRKGFPGS